MDKRLIDIVEQETEILSELGELERRIAKAENEKDIMYGLWEQGIEEIVPYIERREAEIAGMYGMRRDYEKQLSDIREKMAEFVRTLVEGEKIIYAIPRLRTDITLEEAKDILLAAQDKIRNRVPGRKTIRKGRVRYGKINKIQN